MMKAWLPERNPPTIHGSAAYFGATQLGQDASCCLLASNAHLHYGGTEVCFSVLIRTCADVIRARADLNL